MIRFPRHKCGLFLTHNEHKDYYETAAFRIDVINQKDFFDSPEDLQKAIDTDDYWCLQWYPDTPIGSYSVCGTDLNDVLRRALEIDKKNETPKR